MSYSLILLHAGRSKRLANLGSRALIKIKKEPLLQRQVRAAREAIPDIDIICSAGYEAEKVYQLCKKLNIKFVENVDFEQTGSYKSLVTALRVTNSKNIFISHGDLFLNKKDFYCANGQNHAIFSVLEKRDISFITTHSSSPVVTQFSYGLPLSFSKFIYFSEEYSDFLRVPLTSADKTKFDFELYNDVIDMGVKIVPVNGNIHEINTLKDLECAQLL